MYNKAFTKDKRRELRKNETKEEKIMWRALRNRNLNGYRFVRQFGIGPYIADFYCPEKKLVVEIDGAHHYTEEGMKYDKEREEYMTQFGIKTVRFDNRWIIENIEVVLYEIEKLIDSV